MLRLLISEGQIDHLLAIPQAGGTPLTKKIKRNGPVAVIVTSARDNIESEMLTLGRRREPRADQGCGEGNLGERRR
jgi:hypothetical protein